MAMVSEHFICILCKCTLVLVSNLFSIRLFILEGAPSVVLAAFSAWYLPNKPETAKFLTNEEREFAVRRLESGKNKMPEISFYWH